MLAIEKNVIEREKIWNALKLLPFSWAAIEKWMKHFVSFILLHALLKFVQLIVLLLYDK